MRIYKYLSNEIKRNDTIYEIFNIKITKNKINSSHFRILNEQDTENESKKDVVI